MGARGIVRTPSEKSIVKSIQRYLTSIGAWHSNEHGSEFGRRGIPDLLVCYRGKFFAFEVKKPKVGVLSTIQKIEIARIRKAGGVAEVVTSAAQVKEIIEREAA